MYKYRAIECVADGQTIAHCETESEFDAKMDAKRIVNETHHSCLIQRYDGHEWQTGSICYTWVFDRVCYWNHR